MVDIISPTNALICPRGKPGLEPLCLDLTMIHEAESRIQEVAFVTPHKAPELLASFNKTFLELTRYITALKFERVQSEKIANRIRSKILLDQVPEILKEKGLTNARSPAGSEDLRNAILDSNDEYQSAKDICDQIDATIELFQGKLRAIEMAYTSVKKIIGENAYNMSNSNLKHNTEQDDSSPSWYGKPRY